MTPRHSKFYSMVRLIVFAALSFLTIYAEGQNELPDVKIRDLSGQELNFRSFGGGKDTAVVVNLWATWCIPCINELESINEQYADRQKETPFKIIAISIDDTRTSGRVRSFVKGKGWTFDIYLDVNSDLKRALNVNDVPHILIIKNGKIVYQHNGYLPGNEEELFEKLKTI
jgi:cytochrome c biogenesis protein CcmG/thiol:disulfide interchange protein DsbE